MGSINSKRVEIKLRILHEVHPLVPKPVIYSYQKEAEEIADIEDGAERERKLKALIEELNKYKEEGKEDE